MNNNNFNTKFSNFNVVVRSAPSLIGWVAATFTGAIATAGTLVRDYRTGALTPQVANIQLKMGHSPGDVKKAILDIVNSAAEAGKRGAGDKLATFSVATNQANGAELDFSKVKLGVNAAGTYVVKAAKNTFTNGAFTATTSAAVPGSLTARKLPLPVHFMNSVHTDAAWAPAKAGLSKMAALFKPLASTVSTMADADRNTLLNDETSLLANDAFKNWLKHGFGTFKDIVTTNSTAEDLPTGILAPNMASTLSPLGKLTQVAKDSRTKTDIVSSISLADVKATGAQVEKILNIATASDVSAALGSDLSTLGNEIRDALKAAIKVNFPSSNEADVFQQAWEADKKGLSLLAKTVAGMFEIDSTEGCIHFNAFDLATAKQATGLTKESDLVKNLLDGIVAKDSILSDDKLRAAMNVYLSTEANQRKIWSKVKVTQASSLDILLNASNAGVVAFDETAKLTDNDQSFTSFLAHWSEKRGDDKLKFELGKNGKLEILAKRNLNEAEVNAAIRELVESQHMKDILDVLKLVTDNFGPDAGAPAGGLTKVWHGAVSTFPALSRYGNTLFNGFVTGLLAHMTAVKYEDARQTLEQADAQAQSSPLEALDLGSKNSECEETCTHEQKATVPPTGRSYRTVAAYVALSTTAALCLIVGLASRDNATCLWLLRLTRLDRLFRSFLNKR